MFSFIRCMTYCLIFYFFMLSLCDAGLNDLPKAVGMSPDLIERQTKRAEESEMDQLMAALGIRKGMVVLDVGTGSGQYAYAFAEKLKSGGKVFATDVNPDMVHYVQAQSIKKGLKNLHPVLVKANGVDPFYSTNRYDVIFMAHTHFYIDHLEDYLRTMKAYLSPTGRFVILSGKHPVDFKAENITDLDGLLAAIAKEGPTSPFYAYFNWLKPQDYQMSLEPDNVMSLKVRLAGTFNAIQRDLNFFNHFLNEQGSGFKEDIGLTPQERKTLYARSIFLKESGRVDEHWHVKPESEAVHRVGTQAIYSINQTLIIQQFRMFLDNGKSPFLPGGRISPNTKNIDRVFVRAGYKLDKEYDFIPYEWLSVYKASTNNEK